MSGKVLQTTPWWNPTQKHFVVLDFELTGKLKELYNLFTGQKHKDTPDELRVKKAVRVSRTNEPDEAHILIVYKSCKARGNSTKRSPVYPNHDMTLLQLLNRDLGPHQRYTLSITLSSFILNNVHVQRARDRIVLQSSFLREVVVLYGRLTIVEFQHHYPRLQHLQTLYTELIQTNEVNLTVNLNGLKNYGAVVSSACKTIAITYNNYYDLSITAIKKIVYEHLLDSLLIRLPAPLQIPDQILPENTTIKLPRLSAFLNKRITPVRNILPTIPVNKATLSRNLQAIMHWRFIKVDSENVKSFFEQGPQKIRDKSSVAYTRRLFFHFFNFKKFKINDIEALINLPNEKSKMFLNSIYTDGYMFRVSFARRTAIDPLNYVELTTNDFNIQEIAENCRVCTVDPGRRDAFKAYYGDDGIRCLTRKEYYSASGSVKRMINEDARKVAQGIKEVGKYIPSVRNSCKAKYLRYFQNSNDRPIHPMKFGVAMVGQKCSILSQVQEQQEQQKHKAPQ
ncbi:hypothetical protein PHYBLDRAFT_182351 [Phycomyces blakesleeanus NRRL 1555(-)]|uniref:Uncharacterized protein n=1 Tax=Phycomyces blakesleeanus (strain ATCC 8743b / DSM 1359 / FGSC 10004 / NBRC 33097 / NRRL 1555) TaxID=763407 RepID=A0A167LQ99_PHYB8|nr:hypothetical protein PHYBLDRAFT_182351 [Phycomyces blakesleeanus NRRL 1555(-)]OAD70894.1 hypothetical protein PHYBLDRAFT_182351 [Phycomyces blakesleeanus NRRL 1555(-)]|eukprot:XP_018288934.1 hypothetical protein PHYBLDRAFT_182351 [Phycomyces blakesleeanus NRRL 1555(-)]